MDNEAVDRADDERSSEEEDRSEDEDSDSMSDDDANLSMPEDDSEYIPEDDSEYMSDSSSGSEALPLRSSRGAAFQIEADAAELAMPGAFPRELGVRLPALDDNQAAVAAAHPAQIVPPVIYHPIALPAILEPIPPILLPVLPIRPLVPDPIVIPALAQPLVPVMAVLPARPLPIDVWPGLHDQLEQILRLVQAPPALDPPVFPAPRAPPAPVAPPIAAAPEPPVLDPAIFPAPPAPPAPVAPVAAPVPNARPFRTAGSALMRPTIASSQRRGLNQTREPAARGSRPPLAPARVRPPPAARPPVPQRPRLPPVPERPPLPPVPQRPRLAPVLERPRLPPVPERPRLPPVPERPRLPPVPHRPRLQLPERPRLPPLSVRPIPPPAPARPATPPPRQPSPLPVDAACIICFDNISNTVLLPCGHLVLCEECAAKNWEVTRRAQRCPVCRRDVEGKVRVYRG